MGQHVALLRRAVLAIAIVALAGCGSDDGSSGGGDTGTRVPGPTDTIVVYSRTGGFIGVQERLAVRPDGAARVQSKGETTRFELSQPELDGLRAAARAVDPVKLKRVYGTPPGPADGFETTLTTGNRTVLVLQDGKPPPELRRLASVCAGLVQQHAPR